MAASAARRQLWRIAATVALAFVLPGLIAAVNHLRSSRRIRRELARIRAAGLPATPEDLEAMRRPPDGPLNGWPLIAGACKLLNVADRSRRGEPTPFATAYYYSSAYSAHSRGEAMRICLDHYRAALDLAHRGADRPVCIPLQSYGVTGASAAAYFHGLRELFALLDIEAECAARDGRRADALRAVRDRLKIAWGLVQYGTDETLERGMYTGLSSVPRILEQVMSEVRLTDAQLTELDRLLARFDDRKLFENMRIAERCYLPRRFDMELVQVRIECAYGMDAPPDWQLRLLTWLECASGQVRRDQAETLAMMDRIIRLLDQPAHESRRRLPAITEAVAELPGYCRAAHATHASTEYLLRRFSVACTEIRCARVALAAELFRNRRGRLPHRLAELVPEHLPKVPIDAWTGKPLQLKRTVRSWLVHTPGDEYREPVSFRLAVENGRTAREER